MASTTGIPPRTSIQELFILLVPSLLIPAFFLLVRKSQSTPNPYIYEKLQQKSTPNLADEEDPKYSGTPISTSGQTEWKVKGLLVHPIKSCGGFELDTVKVDGGGILWDRKFAVAEWTEVGPKPGKNAAAKWIFRTLRAPGYEKLALVKPQVWLKKGSDTEGLLVVKFPYVPSGPLAPFWRLLMSLRLLPKETSFQCPLQPPLDHDYPKQQVDIWGDSPTWLNYQRHVPRSLQTLVNAKNPVTLFRVDPAAYREVHGNAPKVDAVGYQPIVGFPDSYPLSIQNLASVRDVATKLAKDFSHFTVRRFRPNLVVTGGAPFDEDDWQRIRVGGHEIYCSCLTTRCKLPCVDPDTALRHKNQPEEYLRKHRAIDPGDPKKGCLGLQMVSATNKLIEISVGDTLEVLERGQHRYVK